MSDTKITVRGYTLAREAEYGGLMIVRNAEGFKIGQTQTERAARFIVRNDERRLARERATLDAQETRSDRDAWTAQDA